MCVDILRRDRGCVCACVCVCVCARARTCVKEREKERESERGDHSRYQSVTLKASLILGYSQILKLLASIKSASNWTHADHV